MVFVCAGLLLLLLLWLFLFFCGGDGGYRRFIVR